MKHDLTAHVREAGYEVLFHLGGFLALAAHPTARNQERIFQWIDESMSRREHVRRLVKRGLLEPAGDIGDEGAWVRSLTEKGRAAFAGGRHPETAWERAWDGNWRLLSFDLPRGAQEARMKLRRWLTANHFGSLQGSVWISPDPVPAIETVIESDRLEASMFMVFEGAVAGGRRPPEVAAEAWDFKKINAAHQEYLTFAERSLKRLGASAVSPAALSELLAEDRKRWWKAVRRDPLLPGTLNPRGYKGFEAWKKRGKLLRKLAQLTVGAQG